MQTVSTCLWFPLCQYNVRQATAMELLINIDVDDLEPAIAFYPRGVGLRLGRRRFEPTRFFHNL